MENKPGGLDTPNVVKLGAYETITRKEDVPCRRG